ncbi:unnamed protein product, partial [Brassica rapa subsp. trilocularis]
LGFRSEVSGGESRCVRTAGSACDTGWVFSAAFLSLYGRDWVCGWSGGVALEFLSPHLIKMGAWRWRSSALHPLGFSVSG